MATLSSCKITVVLAQMADGVRYEHMAKKITDRKYQVNILCNEARPRIMSE